MINLDRGVRECEVVNRYLQYAIGGTTAAIKLGWKSSGWQIYIAQTINLAGYLA